MACLCAGLGLRVGEPCGGIWSLASWARLVARVRVSAPGEVIRKQAALKFQLAELRRVWLDMLRAEGVLVEQRLERGPCPWRAASAQPQTAFARAGQVRPRDRRPAPLPWHSRTGGESFQRLRRDPRRRGALRAKTKALASVVRAFPVSSHAIAQPPLASSLTPKIRALLPPPSLH